jgi:ATP-dependent DNA helicase RecG
MLQKAKSATTSSKSSTSKTTSSAATTGEGADTPIQFVKGVGPKLGFLLKSRGLATIRDLFHFFPRAYEDRTKLKKVSQVLEGENTTLTVKIGGVKQIPIRSFGKASRSILEVRASDETGGISLKWFHAPRGMAEKFTASVGAELIVNGTIKMYMNRPEIVHPEISWSASSSEHNVGRVIPVYVEIEAIPTRSLRKILFEALEKYANTLTEDLPEKYLSQHGLPKLSDAIRDIHFPVSDSPEKITQLVEFNTPAHWRLIYEEFFKFEYLVLRQRLRMEKQAAPSFGKKGGPEALASLEKILPFQLTGGQKKAIKEIIDDITKPHPMNRLIQGDVGSGKTAVAFLSSAFVLAEGAQAALMAPTEILAEQHYLNAIKLFGGRLNVGLLTGKSTAAERKLLLARLKGGEPMLLIGTHALIEDPVEFANLNYIMIDEQHRFGVEQRRTLRLKGIKETDGKKSFPHSLILTATPIPRTLALTAYGDLAVTSITEMPPGRTPIITKLCQDNSNKARAYETIRKELKDGHQAYFIYPLVQDSEAEGFTHLKSAIAEHERLQKEVFPDFKVGLLHGQMRPDEKAKVMDEFKRKELHILVSTTVVEVGVDVPNATIMAIEHAERFGLSQLHQLRGRVGRGAAQSYCFLFSHPRVGEISANRLEVLEETNDGFKIAEADLEIRGPGEFLGTRQAGGLPFRLANLVRDREWLLRARDDAALLLKEDPELLNNENSRLRRYYEREGKIQFERLKTS